MKLLIKAYETIKIQRVLNGWDKDTTIKAYSDALTEEINNGNYSEDEKTKMRTLYVIESSKLK